MPEAHPLELRLRVVAAYEAGQGSYPEIAARFAVGEASVKRWVWIFNKTGTVDAKAKGGGTPSSIEATDVHALVARLGDPTAGELAAAFNQSRRGRARIHVSSMKRALYRYGYVVKKSDDGRWRVSARTS